MSFGFEYYLQGYPDFDRTSGAAYVPGICDWSEVTSNSDLTLPSCTLGEFLLICN